MEERSRYYLLHRPESIGREKQEMKSLSLTELRVMLGCYINMKISNLIRICHNQ